MDKLRLTFRLKSEATFGRGEGVAGLVDEEVEHDPFGLPFLRGRTLKGLWVEECANVLYALRNHPCYHLWEKSADRLFGQSGRDLKGLAILRISDATLPQELRRAVQVEIAGKQLNRVMVLESLTTIRQQTAMDETGRPDDGSLRSMRVILRETEFAASLRFGETPNPHDLALLSACVMAWRRVGTGRNRGRGLLQATLWQDDLDVTTIYFKTFQQEVLASCKP